MNRLMAVWIVTALAACGADGPPIRPAAKMQDAASLQSGLVAPAPGPQTAKVYK